MTVDKFLSHVNEVESSYEDKINSPMSELSNKKKVEKKKRNLQLHL